MEKKIPKYQITGIGKQDAFYAGRKKYINELVWDIEMAKVYKPFLTLGRYISATLIMVNKEITWRKEQSIFFRQVQLRKLNQGRGERINLWEKEWGINPNLILKSSIVLLNETIKDKD